MLKALFTPIKFLIVPLLLISISSVPITAVGKKTIVITSQTLTADNKNNIAVFEGSVVAKNEDIIIYSDKMEVSYNNYQGKITKIRAYGNVRVHKNERAIFSKEAIYSGEEEKIVFTGEPKAVEGENVITGTEIIYFLQEDRTVVKDSRVVLKKNEQ
jgi:lipopolysaccharide export system protein LptA